MVDEEKLKKTVIRSLNMNSANYRGDLKKDDIPEWDSLGHLNLIFSIEEAFDVKFEATQIPRMTSLQTIREALTRG